MPVAVKLSSSSVAFCASARSGLGHLRRTATIAAALKRLAPGTHLSLITNASVTGLSAEDQAQFGEIAICERSDMARAAASLNADAVVVDTAVVPDLELLPVPLVLVLRETVMPRQAAFQLPGGRLWHDVIVPAPQDSWTPDESVVRTQSVTHVGWIYRPVSAARAGLLGPANGCRTILVATGGGGNSETATSLVRELDPVIERVRQQLPRGLRILQISGPRAAKDGILCNVDAVMDVGSRLDEAFAEADLVISTVGYNSVLELALTETPAVLIPIVRTYDDQRARARQWGERLGLDHQSANPARTADWISATIAAGRRRPAVDLGPSGCAGAARRIAHALGADQSTQSRPHIKLPVATAPPIALITHRSRVLFAQGVSTCPATITPDGTAMAFAHVAGPTAFEVLEEELKIGLPHVTGRQALFEAMLRPLARLHEAHHEGLSLPQLDATRRIAPRLKKSLFELPNQLAQFVEALCNASLAVPLNKVVAHGDFHLRQLIRRDGREDFVLVDLDDLSFGPAESDIGNCLAHLATCRLSAGQLPHLRFAEFMPRFVTGYENASQRSLDEGAVRLYGALALIRRALKLAERGAEAAIAADIIASAVIVAGGTFGDRFADGLKSKWPVIGSEHEAVQP